MNPTRGFWVAAAAGAVFLAVSRPAQADVPTPPADFDATTETVNLAGAEWTGNDGAVAPVVVFHFERCGVLAYSYNGNSYRNGTWKQTGNSLYFEMNNKYRECQATIRGNRIEGDSWNVQGTKWKTTIQKSKSSP